MTDEVDRTVVPIRRPAFSGVTNQTLGGSEPEWGLIGHVQPPAGAPNGPLVLIDDAGFGKPSTFGGPIRIPNYDRMAARCGGRWRRSKGGGVKELKAAFAEAQAGMGG